MNSFTVHDPRSVPVDSAGYLQNAEKTFGFVPNVVGILAESPAAVEAYLDLNRIFNTTALSCAERQVVLLTASRHAHCNYGIACHSAIAELAKVPSEIIDAIIRSEPLAIYKLDALRTFTIALVDKRGRVSSQDIQAFLEAGYGKRHLLETIAGLSLITLSNYVNPLANTPVDRAYANTIRPETRA